jgi:VWFA-related protein
MRHSQPDCSLLNSLHQSWMALLAGACLTVAVVFGVAAIPVLAADHKASPRQRMTFVELGTVVVDDNDRPVRGLHRKDFQVKEDGHEVKVTSFTEVPAAGVAGPGNGRSLVLLLDDTGVGPAATTIVQNIARRFLSRATPADAVAAVRLTHHDDEAVGSLQGALERVDEYMAKSLPYFGFETVQESLEALAKISTQLEPIEHRRKVVVCIGRRSLCDPYLEDPVDSLVWRQWRDALSATARANVSQYVVDPAGVTGRVDLGDGLVEHTGGADFVRSNNFERAVDQIWEEAGHYYLLGYAPTAHPRDLHSIHVTVKGKGLHVRARLDRGD